MAQRREVRRVYVYNESVSYDTYRAFDGRVRTSKLREVAGTLTLSMDAGALEIVAAFKSASSPSAPQTIAQARTVESLFAKVLSILTALPPPA